MSKMIQIRNVPDRIHREIKARAALAGTSLSDYLLRELERLVARPTRDELLERLEALPVIDPDPEPARVIREERDRR